MYIYGFLVDAVKSATKALLGGTKPRREGRGGRGDEGAPLVTGDGDPEAPPAAKGEGAPSSRYGTDGARDDDDPRDYEELLGLTGGYQSWASSGQAHRTALRHLAGYLMLVVICFSFVLEKWKIVDSLYFAVVVFTTVGYGDLSPTSDASRLIAMVLAFYGIVILGIFLGLVGDVILERYTRTKEDKMSNARLKVMEQFGEHDSALPPREKSFVRELGEVCWAEAPIILCLVALGAPIAYLEGWNVVMGLYWMMITGSTVGFGDLQPSSTTTRCIAIVWIPLAVAVLGEFLGQVAGIYLHRQADEAEHSFLARSMTLADVHRMDTDHDGKVSKDEFLCYMLVALQKVEQKDIDDVHALFDKFDTDHNGDIEKEDILGSYNLSVRPGVTMDAAALAELQGRGGV